MTEASKIYGIRIRSNGPIPGLSYSADTSQPDVSILLQSTPAWLKALV